MPRSSRCWTESRARKRHSSSVGIETHSGENSGNHSCRTPIFELLSWNPLSSSSFAPVKLVEGISPYISANISLDHMIPSSIPLYCVGEECTIGGALSSWGGSQVLCKIRDMTLCLMMNHLLKHVLILLFPHQNPTNQISWGFHPTTSDFANPLF